MTKDEALRLALEALEKISMGGDPRWADEAITAIKAALEMPHELTLKEFSQMIEDDPNYHKWLKEKNT